ncbi:hypothetical protein M5K25_011254 [Dendrobium thyrsiflorum]|uniref:Uncharacterized protein n=1 Tax=Dendrobium thyrsiflorum TaxID=117978 RepID=A0ABD0V9E2_DENTH
MPSLWDRRAWVPFFYGFLRSIESTFGLAIYSSAGYARCLDWDRSLARWPAYCDHQSLKEMTVAHLLKEDGRFYSKEKQRAGGRRLTFTYKLYFLWCSSSPALFFHTETFGQQERRGLLYIWDKKEKVTDIFRPREIRPAVFQSTK